MALVGACLDATSTLVPITVLQLLVVEVFRKGREYPPVMRGWWAILLTLQLGASASELELWNAIFALELTVVLLLTVVMLLRKGQEYPLVLRSSVATLMTVCFVDSSVTGVVLEPGARTENSEAKKRETSGPDPRHPRCDQPDWAPLLLRASVLPWLRRLG
ncbi:hypothetical protein AK812_SmicGene48029 [Symbiodinium microadriaticum]|uniref:Uncharacterized protein n=1 Tax=Symbiodinium microadriaticum TaxID=2951 RepID=A0A1Q9BQV4_SYMMI|nr:hypothetical protein AK812_SmicGene48029 [Symbiodinium microadriaticum]